MPASGSRDAHSLAAKTLRPSRSPTLIALLVVLTVVAVLGAAQLKFLCDDAFITFRYVSNARDGHGLVWNPAPFAPVEGYTSFLWAMWLWLVWSWFGVEPPLAVHASSITCGVLTLAIVAHTLIGMRRRDGGWLSDCAVLMAMLLVVSNRTFLTWMTSGLETALFNLCLVAWVVLAFRSRDRRDTLWAAMWSATATAVALTRPDGLLVVAATAASFLWGVFSGERDLRRTLLGTAPLLAVLLHVAWRVSFYGEWLPNTYYAKVTEPWPEAGVRYLKGFALENGAWLWPMVAGLWVCVELRRGLATAWRALMANVPACAAVSVVLVHVSYYVFRVGGDAFEYRVLSQLVPLAALALAAMGGRIGRGRRWPFAAAACSTIASLFAWVHFAYSDPVPSTFARPIAHRVPWPLRGLADWHDRNQAWMQSQLLCCRRGMHERFLDGLRAELPERTRMTSDANDIPMAKYQGVGLAGWVLPDVAILDELGLNDWVVARTPPRSNVGLLPPAVLDLVLQQADIDGDGRYQRQELAQTMLTLPGVSSELADDVTTLLLLLFAESDPEALSTGEADRIAGFIASMRFIAHERLAPTDYVSALAPNVQVVNRQVVVVPREQPLTPERLRVIEAEWRSKVSGHGR